MGFLFVEDHCGVVNERTRLEPCPDKNSSISDPQLDLDSSLVSSLANMPPASISPVSASSDTRHSQFHTTDQGTNMASKTHERSIRLVWTPYTLLAYEKESQMLAGKEGCRLPLDLQGNNIYSKYCPVSESNIVFIELRVLPDRCPNREIQG
jgi:hypothetical protein